MWEVMGYGRVQGNPKITRVLVKLSVRDKFRRFIERWGDGGREVGVEKHNEGSGIVVETDVPYCDEGLLGSPGVTVQHHEKEIHREPNTPSSRRR